MALPLPAAAIPFILILAACAPPDTPRSATQTDPTSQPWYAQTTAELNASNRAAADLIRKGNQDEAATRIVKGEELSKRLMSVPQPTFEATAAASDVDELYGRMLLSNRNYGWARMLFQKNVSRWKYRKPATPETEARLKQALDEIAECDRHLAGGR